MATQVLHQLSWPEVLTTTKATIDFQGKLWCGPDRKIDDASIRPLFSAWLRDCQFRARQHNDLKPVVMASFQALKGFSTPPTTIDQMPKVIDLPEPQKSFKPPKWGWSYSSINTFKTCPLQWAHKYYYKTIKFFETDAVRYGNTVHKALENAVLLKPTAAETQLITNKNWGKYVSAIVNAPGAKKAEFEMGLDDSWKPINWFKATGRNKADVLVINGDTCSYFDWKTGTSASKYFDDYQIRLTLLFIALHLPDIKKFTGKLICLDVEQVIPKEKIVYERKDLMATYEETQAYLTRMRQAWDSEVFQPTKNGLCRQYCEVRECAHCGGGR